MGREVFSHSLAKYCNGYKFTPAQIAEYKALHQHLTLYSTHFPSHQLQEARELREEAVDYQCAREALSKEKCFTRSGVDITDTVDSDRSDEWIVAEKPGVHKSPIHFFRIDRSLSETTDVPDPCVPDDWMGCEEAMVFFKPRSMLAEVDDREITALSLVNG